MKVATTYDERIALIKEIAERKKKMTKLRKKSSRVLKSVQPKKKEIEIPKESNIYQWTDASKYAKQYYGDTFYETTRYDNDWD
jgi:hypothetical protein